jgi:rSAM/selenodomain-associated transferase 1
MLTGCGSRSSAASCESSVVSCGNRRPTTDPVIGRSLFLILCSIISRMPERPVAHDVLLVFAKKPEPGAVKTRLAKEIGAEQAAEIYRRMAEAVWAGTASGAYDRWLVFEPRAEERAMRKWLPGAQAYAPQSSGDLGQRLREAFRQAFDSGARAVAVIATDAPEVTSRDIHCAFQLLSSGCRSAIGPCPDGGYWLLALSEFREDVFDGIPWSSSSVFDETLARLRGDHGAPGILRKLRDVDRLSDLMDLGPPWKQWAERLK